ncbi:hypothetical protein ACN6AT_01535 [Streptomyces sp. JL4002]|uniref:hypothetical protein n=1 Tax=Streptomyces TaxID=1883 RepID=UPI003B28C72C
MSAPRAPRARTAPKAARAAAARRTAAGTVCLIVCAALGAGTAAADDNGLAGKSAQDIADASRKAMADLTSMRMVAKVSDKNGTTGLDLRFDEAGDCVGTVTAPGGAGKASVIKRGDDVWMKLDDDLLRSQVPPAAADDAVALINGRYLHGTTSSPLLSDFADFCDLDFFREEFSAKPADASLQKGARTTVDGRPAITVSSTGDGKSGVFAVSTEDQPYLLRIQGSDTSGERVDATFSAFDEPVSAKPPPASDSVDLSKLL